MAKTKGPTLETLKQLTKELNAAVAKSRTAVSLARIAEEFPDSVTPQAVSKAARDLQVTVGEAAATAEKL